VTHVWVATHTLRTFDLSQFLFAKPIEKMSKFGDWLFSTCRQILAFIIMNMFLINLKKGTM